MEQSLSKVLAKAFAHEHLNPILLAKKTSVLFTDKMNARLERWFRLHWAMAYRVDAEPIEDLLTPLD
jgi:hypothetical protein